MPSLHRYPLAQTYFAELVEKTIAIEIKEFLEQLQRDTLRSVAGQRLKVNYVQLMIARAIGTEHFIELTYYLEGFQNCLMNRYFDPCDANLGCCDPLDRGYCLA